MKKRLIVLILIVFGLFVMTACDPPDDEAAALEPPVVEMTLEGACTVTQVATGFGTTKTVSVKCQDAVFTMSSGILVNVGDTVGVEFVFQEADPIGTSWTLRSAGIIDVR